MTDVGTAGSALRCSFASEARGDSLFGTASPADGFLLIEQPGAWGRLALTESALDPGVGTEIGRLAHAASIRVLLIRRPGRNPSPARRRFGLADSMPGRESVRWGSFEDERELLDVLRGKAGGEISDDPVYLVCAHGRHDACCALRGRPVAAELRRLQPEATWECSHVGGDRFAPNVLVLPHGLYYGRVEPERASSIVEAQQRLEVVVDLLRGRSIFAPVVQAAQYFARVHLGTSTIDDLHPATEAAAGHGLTSVALASGEGTVEVTVRQAHGEAAGLLTCHATHPVHPPAFELVSIRLDPCLPDRRRGGSR